MLRRFARITATAGLVAAGTLAGPPARAAIPPRSRAQAVERLTVIRSQVMNLEQDLVDGARTRKAARYQIRKIRKLLGLQRSEKDLAEKRMEELQGTVKELELRRGALDEKVAVEQRKIRRFLMQLHRSIERDDEADPMASLEGERLEAPRRKALANLVDADLKDIETLRADLDDADQLQAKIQDEKQQLAYMIHDLGEQESVLELNRQLQKDLLAKNQDERLAQLENYRKLKSAESQVERLIGEFNARKELEKAVATEREASKEMMRGMFASLKGRLSLPVSGRIVSSFGRSFDADSRLYVFKKGVDIDAGKNQPIHAISAGKIAYAGDLPSYGHVVIIDHGDHFYSLCAHLGELGKKTGDAVVKGDSIGESDGTGTPVYFEIRARNVPVNPLQWVSSR